MADFRQLAVEFVLAEDEVKQNALAKQAAQGKLCLNPSVSVLRPAPC